MPPKRKKDQSPAAGESGRTPGAQPPAAKKSKSDQQTSAQPPPPGRSGGTPAAQPPPAVQSDHRIAKVSDYDQSDLGLLQKFWHEAWGKEDAFKGSREGLNGKTFDYLEFGDHYLGAQRLCHPLPVNRKLCVLQEYTAAYTRFESDPDKVYEDGACIIGQPGIGKTSFIAYAVVQRLRKRLPVAVEEGDKSIGQYWLFTADGVSIHSDRTPLRQHPGIWAFSDSNVHITSPIAAFTDTPGVRTFQLTAPQKVRYREWTKQTEVDFYYMELPSKEDIMNVSLLEGREITRIKGIARKWGPVLRILRQIHDKPNTEKRYEEMVTKQLTKDAKEIGNALADLSNSGRPSTTEESSMIFFIRPRRHEDGLDRQYLDVFVPTPWLQDKVIDAISRQARSQKFEMFNALLGFPEGRGSAGGIFERIVRTYFVNNTGLDVRWYHDGKLGSPERLSFGRLKAFPAKQDLELAHLPCFWRPRQSNFPTIDGAILTDDIVYAVQVATTATHGFSPSGLTSFRSSLKERSELLQGFLVIGYMENQTEQVAKDLIGKMKGVEGADLRVGAVTFGCSIIDRHNARPDDEESDED